MSSTRAYQPRYLQYCRFHRKTPEEMRAYDTERWHGGEMCGFICWMSENLFEFSDLHGHPTARIGRATLIEIEMYLRRKRNEAVDIHSEFDTWLENKVTQSLKGRHET